jgi:hypothetical protein
MFLRRLLPENENLACTEILHCPDLLELTDGDFAVIGPDITLQAAPLLPKPSSCGPDERIVRIPRQLLVRAKAHIPPE